MKDLNAAKTGNNGDWDWFNEFLGIKMPSNYYTFHLFSKICSEYNPHSIVELGTHTGSMSVYLALEALKRGGRFTTIEIDHNLPSPEIKGILVTLNAFIENMDILSQEGREEIKSMFIGKTFLLCDNGHKADEFLAFVPHLKSGDVVAVHDYGTEFFDRDWEKLSDLVKPIYQDEWNKHNVQLCIFEVL